VSAILCAKKLPLSRLSVDYGRGRRLKYDHIIGFILKSVTAAPCCGPQSVSSGQQ
jgi:hypothetical protein